MLKTIINKFYAAVFGDGNHEEEVPYANKRFMFFFSLIVFLLIITLIGKDIAKNIANNL